MSSPGNPLICSCFLDYSLSPFTQNFLTGQYNQSPADDFLSLRVTLEITGGSTLFETFESEEARSAVYTERSRQITWRNALAFAEHLWRTAPHREYVVLFRQESQNVGREAICIYQRWSPHPAM